MTSKTKGVKGNCLGTFNLSELISFESSGDKPKQRPKTSAPSSRVNNESPKQTGNVSDQANKQKPVKGEANIINLRIGEMPNRTPVAQSEKGSNKHYNYEPTNVTTKRESTARPKQQRAASATPTSTKQTRETNAEKSISKPKDSGNRLETHTQKLDELVEDKQRSQIRKQSAPCKTTVSHHTSQTPPVLPRKNPSPESTSNAAGGETGRTSEVKLGYRRLSIFAGEGPKTASRPTSVVQKSPNSSQNSISSLRAKESSSESLKSSLTSFPTSSNRTLVHSARSSEIKSFFKPQSMDGLSFPQKAGLEILRENSGLQTAPADVLTNPLEDYAFKETTSSATLGPRRKSVFIGMSTPKQEEKVDKKQALQDKLMKRHMDKYGATSSVSSLRSTQELEETKSSSFSISAKTQASWKKLYHTFLFGVLIKHTYTKLIRKLVTNAHDSPSIENRSLAYVLKTYGTQPSGDFLRKVKHILQHHPNHRTPDQLHDLERLLSSRLQDFAKLGIKERLHLCKIMYLDYYPKGTVLLWEEHKVTCFYYILSGQIEVFKLNNGGKITLSMMNPGTVFGHARVKVEKATRSACATMTMDSEILYIEKEAYLKFDADLESIKEKKEYLQSIELFKTYDLGEKIFPFFNIYTYEVGDCIQQEGEQSLYIYWVLKGNCKVDRIVPFISNPQTLGKKVKKYDPNEDLKEGDKLVNLKLATQDLSTQDCFPTIPFLGENAKTLRYLGPEALNKNTYISFYATLYASDPRTWLTCSVRATSRVVVGCMNILDFVRLAPREVLFQLAVKPSIHEYPIEDVQKQYLEEQRWETVKKDMIEEAKLS